MRPEHHGRLSALLDEAFDPDNTERDAWLAALPEDVAGFGSLRKLLVLPVATETGGVSRRLQAEAMREGCRLKDAREDSGGTAGVAASRRSCHSMHRNDIR